MHDPETIEIGARRTPAENVKHVIYPVSDSQKIDLLLALLESVHYDSVIVFCRTKHGADRVAALLKRNNHAVAVLHSNRTQREREQALQGFRDGRFEVLVPEQMIRPPRDAGSHQRPDHQIATNPHQNDGTEDDGEPFPVRGGALRGREWRRECHAGHVT